MEGKEGQSGLASRLPSDTIASVAGIASARMYCSECPHVLLSSKRPHVLRSYEAPACAAQLRGGSLCVPALSSMHQSPLEDGRRSEPLHPNPPKTLAREEVLRRGAGCVGRLPS